MFELASSSDFGKYVFTEGSNGNNELKMLCNMCTTRTTSMGLAVDLLGCSPNVEKRNHSASSDARFSEQREQLLA